MFNITEDVFYPESFCESTISSFSWCHTVRICITCQMSCASLQNEIWLVHATKNYKNTTKKSLQDHNQSSVYVFSFTVVPGVLESHGWSFCTHRHQKLGFFRQSRPLNGHLNVAEKKLRGGVECEASQAVNLVRCEWKAAEKKQLNWLFNRFNKVDNVCHRRFIHKPQLSTSQLRVWLQAPSGCSSSSISRRNIPLHFYAIDRLQPLVEDKKIKNDLQRGEEKKMPICIENLTIAKSNIWFCLFGFGLVWSSGWSSFAKIHLQAFTRVFQEVYNVMQEDVSP